MQVVRPPHRWPLCSSAARPPPFLPLLFIIATVIAERNSGWMDARIVGRAAAELAQIFFCAAKCQIWPAPAIDMYMIWIGHDS